MMRLIAVVSVACARIARTTTSTATSKNRAARATPEDGGRVARVATEGKRPPARARPRRTTSSRGARKRWAEAVGADAATLDGLPEARRREFLDEFERDLPRTTRAAERPRGRCSRNQRRLGAARPVRRAARRRAEAERRVEQSDPINRRDVRPWSPGSSPRGPRASACVRPWPRLGELLQNATGSSAAADRSAPSRRAWASSTYVSDAA